MLKSSLVLFYVLLAVLCLIGGCEKGRQPQQPDDQQNSSQTEENTSADQAPQALFEEGLAAVSEDLVLASSTSPHEATNDALGARIALEQVTAGVMPIYPIAAGSSRARGFDIATREVETRAFAREQLADADGAWTAELRDVVDDYIVFRQKEGHSTVDVKFAVAVDRTVPAAQLAALLEVARDAGVGHFELLARRAAALDQAPAADAVLAGLRVFSSPGIATRSSSKPLAVMVAPDGFDLYEDGTKVAPLDGCELSGPTICLAQAGIDAAAELNQARLLQKDGEFEASEGHVRNVLAAYDWERLSGALAKWRQAHPRQSWLHIVPRQDVSVAAVLRTMEIAQFDRASAEQFFYRFNLTRAAPVRTSNEAAAGVVSDEDHQISVDQLRLNKKLSDEILGNGPLKNVLSNEGGSRKQK